MTSLATVRCYRIHGLSIRSDIPLHASQARFESGGVPDLEIMTKRERFVPSADTRASDDVLAELRLPTGGGYSAAERDGVITVTYLSMCQFVFSRSGAVIEVSLFPDVHPDWASIFLNGTVLSLYLEAHGHTVLHASAVETGSEAVAFVGRSGMGKSTLAAMACMEGMSLVTDDVLRFECDRGRVRCWTGSNALRLRSASGSLGREAPILDGFSVDQRRVARFATPGREALPLKAIFLPTPLARASRPSVSRLPSNQALRELLRIPRLPGSRSDEVRRQRFESLLGLVGSIPIYRVALPSTFSRIPGLASWLVGRTTRRAEEAVA